MATSYSPKIITDGLVLALDAANPKSYTGSGTNWVDKSVSNKNATMFGSVPFSTDGRGCFDFSTATGGTSGNSSLGFTFSSNMIPTTGNFTLSVWIKNPNSSSGQVGLFSNAGGGDGYRFGVGLNGIYYLIGPTYQEGTLSFSTSLSSTVWYNVSVVFDRTGTQMRLYLNGVFQDSTSLSGQSAFSNNTPGIVRSPCCTVYTGKLATFFAHSRALTVDEILLNYNSLKNRFL